MNNFLVVIFNWNDLYPNVNNLVSRCQYSNIPHHVISSGKRNFCTNHVTTLSEDAYFKDQWNALLKLDYSSYSHVIHIQGDVKPFSILKLLNRINKALSFGFGIYTPDIDYSDIKHKSRVIKQDDFYITNETDCTCWAIDTQLLKLGVKEFPEWLSFGWGIDWYYAQLSLKVLKKNIILDTGMKINHPHGRGYDSKEALNQFKRLKEWATLEINSHHLFNKNG